MKSTLAFLLLVAFFNVSFAQQINVIVSDELQGQVSGDRIVKAGNHFIKYRTIGSTDHLSNSTNNINFYSSCHKL